MTRLLPLLALAFVACSGIRIGQSSAPPREQWMLTASAAQRAVDAGQHTRADTMLLDFATSHPNTPEALEAVYWRGVLAMDPNNPVASPKLAVAVFDYYLGEPAAARRAEVMVLRRIASRLELLDDLALALSLGERNTAAALATGRPPSSGDARDAEIARLKEELRKATEELDRIRRRVTTPPPGSTPP